MGQNRMIFFSLCSPILMNIFRQFQFLIISVDYSSGTSCNPFTAKAVSNYVSLQRYHLPVIFIIFTEPSHYNCIAFSMFPPDFLAKEMSRNTIPGAGSVSWYGITSLSYTPPSSQHKRLMWHTSRGCLFTHLSITPPLLMPISSGVVEI